ncbi:MAG: pitrilysin family protein [Alphaproteobacteria bacterium]|nr:pitrilysin family protein [Alphaproteobacteria bacterium]
MARAVIRRLGLLAAFTLLNFTSPIHAAVFYPASFMLDNGLQLVVVPNRLAPAVTQMVWYKVGSSDETPGKTGLAHYLEHLMFRGTAQRGPGEFSKTIAAQGGNDNAFTSYDYTAYFETVAADRLPLIMQMEADRMQNLRITPETATPELSVVLKERQERTDNDPRGRFDEKLRQTLMPQHPYGTPIIGWKNEIEKLSVADANKFYEQHYAPNNAVVVISGDVEPDKVLELAKSTYGAVPKRDVSARSALPAPVKPSNRRIAMTDSGVQQPQLTWRAVVPSYSTQKNREAYALEVLCEALDSGEVGLLYREMVMQQGIASGVGAQYDADARGDAIFTISATPNPGKDPGALEKALQKTLKILAGKGLDAKTVKDAVRRLTRAAIFARDNLMMPGYAFGMAVTTGHSVTDVEAWPDRIAAVSPDEVNTALRKLVANPRQVTGLLLPAPNGTHKAQPQTSPHNEGGIR